jgi:hypothetical protein
MQSPDSSRNYVHLNPSLSITQNKVISKSYSAVCAALGLSSLAISPTYVLSDKTHPDAPSKIETVLFGAQNTIFRAGLDRNIFISPIKNQLSYLILEKYKRLANYLIDGLDCVTIKDIKLITVTCKSQNYILPQILTLNAQSAIVLLSVCAEYDHAAKKWIAASPAPSKIRVPFPDASDEILSRVLFVDNNLNHVTYGDLNFYILRGLTNDVLGRHRILTLPVTVRYSDANKAWMLEDLPFTPYQGKMEFISLNNWLKGFIPASMLAREAGTEAQLRKFKQFPILYQQIKENQEKLPFKFKFLYDHSELATWGHRAGWAQVLNQLKRMSNDESNKELLIVDIAEKSFSWDVLFLEQSKVKHIHYNGIDYHVPWSALKFKEEDGIRVHVAKVATDLIVKWSAGQWVKDTEETQATLRERRSVTEDYIEVPFLLMWHNPPNMPKWFDYINSPQMMLERPVFKKSMPNCVGIITFSDYMTQWVVNNVPHDIPTYTLKHPTEIPDNKFSFEKFMDNQEKSLIQIGYWLRRMCFIGSIQTNVYKKVWLYGGKHAMDCIQRECIEHHANGEPCSDMKDVLITRLSDELYDEVLTKNVIILNLYDTSVNNAIIEAIVRHTPVLVNRHPAVIEYLGPDYPLYYDTFEEATKKLHNFDSIKAAHVYLRNSGLDTPLSYRSFLKSFKECPLIQKLCDLANGVVPSSPTLSSCEEPDPTRRSFNVNERRPSFTLLENRNLAERRSSVPLTIVVPPKEGVLSDDIIATPFMNNTSNNNPNAPTPIPVTPLTPIGSSSAIDPNILNGLNEATPHHRSLSNVLSLASHQRSDSTILSNIIINGPSTPKSSDLDPTSKHRPRGLQSQSISEE